MNWRTALAGAIVATIVTRARSPWAPVIGAVLGALFIERLFPQFREQPKAAFTEPLFELAGGIAKADGHVSEAEIATATGWMDTLNLNAAQRKRAIAAFDLGRVAGWRFEPACDSLRTFTHAEQDLRMMVLKWLSDLAAVDAQPAARALLDAIAERLNIPQATWNSFQSTGSDRELAKAYALLDLSPNASDDAVKSAYRAQVARHHPDRLSPSATPEQRRAADERTSRINAAYARIQRARGLD